MEPGRRDAARGWRRLIAPMSGLGPEDAAAVRADRIALNVARVRAVSPYLIAIMGAAGLLSLTVPRSDAASARWLTGVLVIDLAAAATAVVMLLIARSRTETGVIAALRHNIGEIFTIDAVTIGTALAVNTLQSKFRLIAWVIGIMLGTILVHPRRWALLGAHLLSLVAVTLAVLEAHPESGQRYGQLSAAFALTAMQIAFARVMLAGFVRERIAVRRLAEMNSELEDRVAAQVKEIVAHTGRIEALNRQLAGQVKARSDELAAALRRLAVAEHGDGTLPVGTVIGDRFEIHHVLGVGGMGVVYAATDRLADQPVALKVVRAHRDAGHRYRFLQEATAAASLSHPVIVRVLHVDVTRDGRLYQALELVDGQPLDAVLGGTTLPSPIVARLGATVADALATAHAQGVIHRDVKPPNIMITAEPPGCRLLDFGLAKLRESLTTDLSEIGTVVGTPQFLAPEQIQRPQDVSGKSDVYALGVVLYLAASGRLPFDAAAPTQWMFAHVHTEPLPLPGHVAPALAELIVRCLAKEPADRPDARTLGIELTAIADSLGAPALETWARADQQITRETILPDLALPGLPEESHTRRLTGSGTLATRPPHDATRE